MNVRLTEVQRNVLAAIDHPGVTYYPYASGRQASAFVSGDDGRSVLQTVRALARRRLVVIPTRGLARPAPVQLTNAGRDVLAGQERAR